MHIHHWIKPFLFFLLTNSWLLSADACSGYKITIGNKTILGSNEDAWRTTPRIWFEPVSEKQEYGAAFTGSRFDDGNGFAPQSGMNERGLAFERLSAYHPPLPPSSKQPITNPTVFLKEILHQCKTVAEVGRYMNAHDRSCFIEDILFYVDSSGNYLVVEPDHLIYGSEPTYIVSNFCPSITTQEQAHQLTRYRKGIEMVSSATDTTLAYCTSLSDSMHVCRDKFGDGTLLTSLWDLKNGHIHVYFYHQFNQRKSFSLQDELKKGNHILALDSLFSENKEFELLRNYKTPKNYVPFRYMLVILGGMFLTIAFFFLLHNIRSSKSSKFSFIRWLMIPLGCALSYYMYVLLRTTGVYYFPSPYVETGNTLVNLSSYLPYIILLLILPFVIINYRVIKEKLWSRSLRLIFTLNTMLYLLLLYLFQYWKFFHVAASSV